MLLCQISFIWTPLVKLSSAIQFIKTKFAYSKTLPYNHSEITTTISQYKMFFNSNSMVGCAEIYY